MDALKAHVVFVTTPSDAEVAVDGAPMGACPVADLTLGAHRITARRDGYVSLDTTVAVGEAMQKIRLSLAGEPPGALVILGDQLAAEIYVDSEFKVDGVQHWDETLQGGLHNVRVVVNKRNIVQSIMIKPGEQATYDYTKGTVTRKPLAAK